MVGYNFLFYYKYFFTKHIIIILLICIFLLSHKDNNYYSLFSSYFKKRPKISVFIPIYNKEKYINKCIQSLQNQTLKDIEIIAVNDCSNDSSLDILTKLAENDDRIKVVNNDRNHGLLYSRAMGILNSTGEYLLNLDSDDEINDNECLEYLYNKTRLYKIDIIQYSVYFVDLNWTFKCNFNNTILKQPKLYQSTFLPNNEVSDYLIWNKLIRRETFLKAYEDFKIAIYNGKWNYFEDDVWNILVSKYAKSKLCIDKLVYIYKTNNDSLMRNRFRKIEFQNLIYRHQMYKYIFSKKEEEKYVIAEYMFLYNRIKSDFKHLILKNDTEVNTQIKNIFGYFIYNYNFSIETKCDINNFLKTIYIN